MGVALCRAICSSVKARSAVSISERARTFSACMVPAKAFRTRRQCQAVRQLSGPARCRLSSPAPAASVRVYENADGEECGGGSGVKIYKANFHSKLSGKLSGRCQKVSIYVKRGDCQPLKVWKSYSITADGVTGESLSFRALPRRVPNPLAGELALELALAKLRLHPRLRALHSFIHSTGVNYSKLCCITQISALSFLLLGNPSKTGIFDQFVNFVTFGREGVKNEDFRLHFLNFIPFMIGKI